MLYADHQIIELAELLAEFGQASAREQAERVAKLEEAIRRIENDIDSVINDKCNNPTDHANCNWMLINRIEDICREAGTPQEKK